MVNNYICVKIQYIKFISLYIHKHFVRLLPVQCAIIGAALSHTSIKRGMAVINSNVYN